MVGESDQDRHEDSPDGTRPAPDAGADATGVESAPPARSVHLVFAIPTIVALAVVAAALVAYSVGAEGAQRVSGLFACGLIAVGAWLLLWSYVRKPPPGEDDDFLDKLLAGTGQALLLGAVLSFGFGVVGQQLEDERQQQDRTRDLVRQVRADAGGKTYPGVDLADQDLFGLDMTGFDFVGADLAGANVGSANLSSAMLVLADLSGANLSGTNLSEAVMLRADLSSANLADADLSGAYLRNVDFTDAYLDGADFSGADLLNADLTDARFSAICFDPNTAWPDGEPPTDAPPPEDCGP